MSAGRGERKRTEVLLQFWVLGLGNPGIRRRLRAAMKRYQDLFLFAARQTLDGRAPAAAGISPESLAGLSIAVVLGSELASVMEPGWFERWNPTAAVEALLRAEVPS